MSEVVESTPPSAHVVYAADSRLRSPLAFCRAGLYDLRGARPAAICFFRRSMAQRYRYSSLGLFWAFAPSLITALVLVAGQRTRLIGVPGTVPAPFYGIFGLALAQTFLEALNALRTLFVAHQQLLRRNNIPLEGLIAAALLETIFNTVIRMAVLVVACFIFAVKPSLLTLPLAVCGLVGVALFGAALGLLAAPYNSLKRDIEHVMVFLPWVLFAVTPVFVAAQTGSLLTRVYHVNPLAWGFDSIRTAAYGAPGPLWPAVLILPVGVVLLAFGWLSCRLWRPYVVEKLLV